MKKLIAGMALAAALAAPALLLAEVETGEGVYLRRNAITLTTNIVGGSLTLTNRTDFPWQISSASYLLPQNWTNTFTIVVEHSYDIQFEYLGTSVVTNAFGNVETNVSLTITNTIERVETQTVFRAVTTNKAGHIYGQSGSKVDGEADANVLTSGLYIQPGDRMIYSLTATNSLPLKINGIH